MSALCVCKYIHAHRKCLHFLLYRRQESPAMYTHTHTHIHTYILTYEVIAVYMNAYIQCYDNVHVCMYIYIRLCYNTFTYTHTNQLQFTHINSYKKAGPDSDETDNKSEQASLRHNMSCMITSKRMKKAKTFSRLFSKILGRGSEGTDSASTNATHSGSFFRSAGITKPQIGS
jgi:hypothetical protein